MQSRPIYPLNWSIRDVHSTASAPAILSHPLFPFLPPSPRPLSAAASVRFPFWHWNSARTGS